MYSKQIAKFERVIRFMTSKVETLKAEQVKVQRTIDECPGETDPQRSWLNKAMGNADHLRDEIAYFERQIENQREQLQSLQALDVHGKVAYDETIALRLYNDMVRARRYNTPTEQLEIALNETLDELQLLYFELERQRRIESRDFQQEVVSNLAQIIPAITDPEKLTGRSRDRVRQARKAVKAKKDQAIRASMKGNEQGGTNRKKERAA